MEAIGQGEPERSKPPEEALQAVHDAEIKLGDAVSVHGLGAIGLLAVQMCRLEGIQTIFGVDPDPRRRELAVRLGATHVLDTATRLLYTDRVVVDGLLGRTFRFDEAPAAYRWLDDHPLDAVKIALAY